MMYLFSRLSRPAHIAIKQQPSGTLHAMEAQWGPLCREQDAMPLTVITRTGRRPSMLVLAGTWRFIPRAHLEPGEPRAGVCTNCLRILGDLHRLANDDHTAAINAGTADVVRRSLHSEWA